MDPLGKVDTQSILRLVQLKEPQRDLTAFSSFPLRSRNDRSAPPPLTLSDPSPSSPHWTLSDSPRRTPRRLNPDDRLPSSVLASVVERGLAAAGTPTKARASLSESEFSNGDAPPSDTPGGSALHGDSRRESVENGVAEEKPAASIAHTPASPAAKTPIPSPALAPRADPEPNGAPAAADGDDPSEGKLSVSYFLERVLPRARHTDTVVVLRGAGAGAGLSAETEAAILERKKQRGGVVLALVDVVVGEHDRILCLG